MCVGFPFKLFWWCFFFGCFSFAFWVVRWVFFWGDLLILLVLALPIKSFAGIRLVMSCHWGFLKQILVCGMGICRICFPWHIWFLHCSDDESKRIGKILDQHFTEQTRTRSKLLDFFPNDRMTQIFRQFCWGKRPKLPPLLRWWDHPGAFRGQGAGVNRSAWFCSAVQKDNTQPGTTVGSGRVVFFLLPNRFF